MKDKEHPKLNPSLILGFCSSLASLVGASYFFYHNFNFTVQLIAIIITTLFCGVLETGRIYFMREWRSGDKQAPYFYFFIAAGILAINIFALDFWAESEKAEKLADVNAKINAAINQETGMERRKIEERYEPLKAEVWKHYSQNVGIHARKNNEESARYVADRENQYNSLIMKEKKEIKDLLENQSTRLSENRTVEKINGLVGQYGIAYDVKATVKKFGIAKIKDSVGLFWLSVFIALALEVLIFKAFAKGFRKSKVIKLDSSPAEIDFSLIDLDSIFPKLIQKQGGLIALIEKDQEIIKEIAYILSRLNGNQGSVKPKLRKLFAAVSREVKNAKKKMVDIK